jgi:hypothetical protein
MTIGILPESHIDLDGVRGAGRATLVESGGNTPRPGHCREWRSIFAGMADDCIHLS